MNDSVRVGRMPRQAWPAAARRAATLAATALVLLSAACGSTPAQSGPPRSGSSSGRSAYDQALAYATCMRGHGVPKWTDPNRNGSFAKSSLTPQRLGVSASQIRAAEAVCQHLNPHTGPTQAQVEHYRSTMMRYARCMRAHGIGNFPDPDSRGHLRIGPGTDVRINTPQFQAAFHACRYTFSAGGGSGS